MRIFLDKTYDRILKVAAVINNNKPMTIKKISEKTNLSIPTVKKIIECLEKNKLSTSDNLYIEKYQNKIISIQAVNYPLQHLADDYLKSSIQYLMIKQIFENKQITSNKFCRVYSISESSFSRHRIRLKKYLQSINLDLNTENEIVGNEILIRIFFINFFQHAHSQLDFLSNIYSDISNIYLQSINDTKWGQLSDRKKKVVELIFYVTNKRIAQYYRSSDVFFKNLSVALKNTLLVRKLTYFYISKGISVEQAYLEIGCVLFILRKEDLILNNNICSLINEFLPSCERDVKISQMLSKAVVKDKKNLPKSKNLIYDLTFMNITLQKGYIPYKNFYYIYEEENFYCFNIIEKGILENSYSILDNMMQQKEVSSYYNSFIQLYSFKELVDYFFIVLYGIFIKNNYIQPRAVTIFIEHSKFMNHLILSTKLKDIFGDMIQIVDDYENKIDLLVTDTGVTLKKNIIRVSSYADEKDFELLLLKILDIRKKIVEEENTKKLLPYLTTSST